MGILFKKAKTEPFILQSGDLSRSDTIVFGMVNRVEEMEESGEGLSFFLFDDSV